MRVIYGDRPGTILTMAEPILISHSKKRGNGPMFVCQKKEEGRYVRFNNTGRYTTYSQIGEATRFQGIADLLDMFTKRGANLGYPCPFNQSFVDFRLVMVREVPNPKIEATGMTIG